MILKKCYKDKLPVFISHSLIPFDYYLSRQESFLPLMELLNHQFSGEEYQIISFLENLIRWFNKEGWLEDDGYLNVKCNTISVVGPPNCGKSFFDCFSAIALNTGEIGRINNRTNHFSLQEAAYKRLIKGNEINVEESAKEEFKKICEGLPVNIHLKNQADAILMRTPLLLMSNTWTFFNGDSAFKERVKTFRWQSSPFLKKYDKKPYPLGLFDVYDYYNIKY